MVGDKKLTSHNFIDHINNNKLDNMRENLRIVTAAENNRNKSKVNNTSSKYLGVVKRTGRKNKFHCQILLNDKKKLD